MYNDTINIENFKDYNSPPTSVTFVSDVCNTKDLKISEIKAEAFKYIEKGWHIFPVHGALKNGTCSCGKNDCNSIGKHPRTRHGLKDASIDKDVVADWVLEPNTNIGTATGQISGLCVLDVDARNGGVESIKNFEAEYGKLPDTPIVITGSGHGSCHYYFKYPEGGCPSRPTALDGVDIKCDGGYVIAPPSIHKSSKEYAWDLEYHPDDIPLADMPITLLNLVRGDSASKHNVTDALPKLTKPPLHLTLVEEGRRNSTVYRVAAFLMNHGFHHKGVEALFLAENGIRFTPALSESELKRTIQSAEQCERRTNIWLDKSKKQTEWSPLLDLPCAETVIPSFPNELIPEPLRAWVLDFTERIQAPPETLAIIVITVFSGLIGCQIAIAPKQQDDWKVIPNLWGMIIAPPSFKKTPLIKEATKFLSKLEAEAKKKYKNELEEYEKKRAQAKDKNYKEAPPKLRRVITNDATVEKVGHLLSENPKGMLQIRDEFYGFLNNLDKSGREGDRQFYLESFNGDGNYTFDRIGRGTIDIPHNCLAMIGGIQPEPFYEYFNKNLSNGSSGDGFLARFQLMIYPQKLSDWKRIDRPPDIQAQERVKQIFEILYGIDFKSQGLEIDKFDEIPICRFAPDAQEVFYEWYDQYNIFLLSEDLPPAIEAHITKNAKLVPALALIFQIISFCDPEKPSHSLQINRESTEMAIQWCQYQRTQVDKIYAPEKIQPHIKTLNYIVKKIKAGDIFNGMTVRDLKRKGWAKLKDSQIISQAFEILKESNWLKIEKESPSGNGAPTEIIYLNPALKAKDKTEL